MAQSKVKAQRDPFEVELSKQQEDDLVAFLCREIDYAEMARDRIVGDHNLLDRAHQMYEGGKGIARNGPWPGAANLGSFIVTEKVDSMRARIAATLFADPVWVVEGFGMSAERAPLVEAFHQWKAEQVKLQKFLLRVTHNSLIEGTGVLEVSDRVVHRKGIRRIRALLQRDAMTGSAMLDPATGAPVPVKSQSGRYEEANEGEPHMNMIVSDVVRATAGPSFRVVSLKNFFILPGHATETEEIWGYVKKLYRRLGELEGRERAGYYRNVDQLTRSTDREQTTEEARSGQDIAPAMDAQAEKELFECTVLLDLDEDGFEEWYIITISRRHRTILRVQYQDYNTPHYLLFTPFPRPNSVWGYSYALDKMGSLYDEHAALRNMFADRTALATAAPFLQLENSPWNPALKPFGPRQVIPVRSIDEIQQLKIADVPASVITAITMVLSAAERLSGQNDVTTGHMAQQDRTLGEVQLVAEQSFVRIDEVVKNFQEGMEDLFNILQIIWVSKLEEESEPLPGDVLLSMTERGIQISDQTITADLLMGTFRGKPHSSVESADFSKMRADFAQMMTALTQMAQTVPSLGMHLNNPVVIRSIVSQLARIYRWPDRANLVSTFTGMMPMAPGQPGLPGQQGAPMAGAPPNVTPPNA